ncbi:MAG TPA: 4-hydroxy-tetrahydrodipicolinate synthase [Myxococcota bacterium]|nr:4-hydroxy-tetrahydrodipicolinate synthase [Myxococcota bacterium]
MRRRASVSSWGAGMVGVDLNFVLASDEVAWPSSSSLGASNWMATEALPPRHDDGQRPRNNAKKGTMEVFMTATNRFAGVHTALVTPFDRDGAIDHSALTEILAMQRMDGISGVVLAGSTGEAPTLTMAERIELVKTAKDHSKDMPIIVGAGSNCTKDAVLLQKTMEDAGADATMQVVPYYNKPTQRGMFEHFSAIAKAAKIPVFLYNASGRTGVDLMPKTIGALVKEHENIVGIKDANTNMERLCDLCLLTKTVRPQFLIMSGEDSALLPFLALGGDGVVSVASHIATSEMMALYHAAQNGDLIYAQKIAQKMNGLCKLLHSHPNPIPIKTIMASMGLLEKSFRLPLCALSSDEEAVLLKNLAEFAWIKQLKTRGLLQ